jgi:hypothetical protein
MMAGTRGQAMSTLAEKPQMQTAYEADLNLWGVEQARLVREGRWQELDIANIAEEIESLGGSQRSEIRNRLTVLLQHLLKWEHQPAKRKYGWRSSINEQRIAIVDLIETSPSLRAYPGTLMDRCYVIARAKAADETGLPEKTFPATCAYSIEQVLSSRFYPGPEEHDIV